MAEVKDPCLKNLAVPFVTSVPGGLREGAVVTVTGRVRLGAERFHLNLQCGLEEHPAADIAFQFNPRYGRLKNYVVCNSMRFQTWGMEERRYKTAAPPGSSFKLTITVYQDCYQVAVNDVPFLEFKHRLPFSDVNAIVIDGGVELESVSY
ncbi:LEG4 protein, partial [Atractosteus spatula]|nr:LEG4 protein [Atractosteus spatula]